MSDQGTRRPLTVKEALSTQVMVAMAVRATARTTSSTSQRRTLRPILRTSTRARMRFLFHIPLRARTCHLSRRLRASRRMVYMGLVRHLTRRIMVPTAGSAASSVGASRSQLISIARSRRLARTMKRIRRFRHRLRRLVQAAAFPRGIHPPPLTLLEGAKAAARLRRRRAVHLVARARACAQAPSHSKMALPSHRAQVEDPPVPLRAPVGGETASRWPRISRMRIPILIPTLTMHTISIACRHRRLGPHRAHNRS